MGVSVVGLGHLTELVVRDQAGDRTIRPKGQWLAYNPAKRELCICRKAGLPAGPLSGSVRRLHSQFHSAPTRRALTAEYPDPVGKPVSVGLVVSLTYIVPKEIRSPGKNRYRWNHEFGDHGQRGRGSVGRSGSGSGPGLTGENPGFSERYMPLLTQDRAGNLRIKRRAGNKFYVGKWLMY